VFTCHQLICALPARWIDHLVLPDEVVFLGERERSRTAPQASGWRLVMVGEYRYLACNLGTQLGMPPVHAAWALLHVEHDGVVLPIALQTGPCLVVQPLGAGAPLPASAFRTRAGAITSMFSTNLLRTKADLVEVGVRLEPSQLWTEAELDQAAALFAEQAR
jgi:hypothetical protein